MLYIDTIDNAVSMHTVFTNLTSFLNHTRYISYVFLILLVTIVQYQSDFLSLKIKSILKILSNYWSVLHLILFCSWLTLRIIRSDDFVRLENRCWLSCLLLKSETPSLLLISAMGKNYWQGMLWWGAWDWPLRRAVCWWWRRDDRKIRVIKLRRRCSYVKNSEARPSFSNHQKMASKNLLNSISIILPEIK